MASVPPPPAGWPPRGPRVAILDLEEQAAAATAAAIAAETGTAALGVGADVRDADAVEAAVQRVVAELGGLHVLVNNAGVTRDNLLFKLTEDDWDTVLGIHLKGAFLLSRAAQKPMVEQRYGRIVNLSSTSALGNRGQANYSAAKMGMQGLTRTLAIELGPFGVTVNAVAPGFIATDMTDATAQRLGLTPEQLRAASARGDAGAPGRRARRHRERHRVLRLRGGVVRHRADALRRRRRQALRRRGRPARLRAAGCRRPPCRACAPRAPGRARWARRARGRRTPT